MFDKLHSDLKERISLSSQNCNVCGGELIINYAKVQDAITKEYFAIYRCTKCGLGHTVPQPQNLTKFYGNDYYNNRHGFTQKHYTKRRIKIICSAIKDRDGKRLLDIGCGDGSFLRAMKNLGWDVAGIEINPKLELMEGIILKENIEELSDCEPFDCITMWHSLEHMQNINLMLNQINSLLNPSGKLIIAVPNNNSFQSNIFKSKWFHLDVPRHLYHFDSSSLQYCLKANGFVVEQQCYQELEYDLLGWTQSALNNIFIKPNIFFDYVRKKRSEQGKLVNMLNLVIGSVFIMLSFPAVILEKLFNRSGTIIIIARTDDLG